MGNAELNGDAVGLIGPDADRSIAVPHHVPAVVARLGVFDNSAAHRPDDDPVPTVVVVDGWITRVVLGERVADVQVARGTAARTDSRKPVLVGVDPKYSGAIDAIDLHTGFLEPRNIQAVHLDVAPARQVQPRTRVAPLVVSWRRVRLR